MPQIRVPRRRNLLTDSHVLDHSGRSAPNGAVPMGVESFPRHAFGEVLLAASLWALATVVLPGVGGLVILTAAGVSIGYGLRASRASPVRGHWWSSVRGVNRRMSSR